MRNNSILRALYNGELYPSERIVPADPDYRLLEQKINEEKEYLKKKLGEEDGERLEKLRLMYRQASAIDDYASFAYGFRLGTVLMGEALTNLV